MSHDGASVPQYLRCLPADATDFRAQKLQPVSRCRVHDFRKSGLLAHQRSMAWLFMEAGIAQVEFVQPNVRVKPAPTVGRQARTGENVPRTARSGLVARRWGSASTNG